MDFIEFIAENLPNDYTFKTTSELSFNFEKDVDNILVKMQQGNRYLKGVIIPVTIIVTTKNISKSLSTWNEWVVSVSDKDVLEGTSNYYMIFQTPTVSQVFDEVSDNYYSTITIFGTIVETDELIDIKSLKIDGVEMTVNTLTYQLTNTPDSEQPTNINSGDDYINTSSIQSSVLSLRVTTFMEDYDSLRTKLFNVRKSLESPDNSFEICITWSNDETETITMKNTSQSFQKNRGAVSLLTLDFVK